MDVRIRGNLFGLNTTFFKLERQIARLDHLGIDRTILSLATPFIDYHLDASLAIEAARIFNDALAASLAGDKARFGAWAFLPMPAEIVELLNREINAGLADPKIADRIAGLGNQVLRTSAAEFGKLIVNETEKWANVVRAANIKPG